MAKKKPTKVKPVQDKDIPDIAALALSLSVDNLSEKQQKYLAVLLIPAYFDLSIPKKAELAGISERYAQQLSRNDEFQTAKVKAVRGQFRDILPQIKARYVKLALSGDRQSLERIMEQAAILDKPEKGDINVNVAVSMEERQKLEQTRITNQSKGLRNIGYALHTDN